MTRLDDVQAGREEAVRDLALKYRGPDWRPESSKTRQPTKRGKPKTSKADWRVLHARKGGPCRLCGKTPYELHHLASKARGGPDEAWNLAPLCAAHHSLVTREDPATLGALAANLLDDEYAGLVGWGGENVLERLFGVPGA